MVRALLTLADDEPSKVPFHIAGAAFAAWAVLLSYLDLSRASFPGRRRGQGARSTNRVRPNVCPTVMSFGARVLRARR
jgi:hypothetical protein